MVCRRERLRPPLGDGDLAPRGAPLVLEHAHAGQEQVRQRELRVDLHGFRQFALRRRHLEVRPLLEGGDIALQRVGDLQRDADERRESDRSRADHVIQGLSLEQLHHDERPPLAFVEREDGWMRPSIRNRAGEVRAPVRTGVPGR